ncbi:helix-turn-helix transcriptional regulator [Solimonas marina]|uniref:AlpA family phage regulatory protein n=1 Tax=Solimonas marina TaxID=2714601 RepID=A0A970B816_9GAMM|nr:AlpA family phage regulatory protein [Solimonas marina]NKF24503.1 AlpA family phage regulatory protein [Solimonas marina]
MQSSDSKKRQSSGGALLRPREQWMRLGLKRSTYYALRKSDPTYPTAFSLTPGGRAVVVKEDELEAWIESKAAQRVIGGAQ